MASGSRVDYNWQWGAMPGSPGGSIPRQLVFVPAGAADVEGDIDKVDEHDDTD